MIRSFARAWLLATVFALGGLAQAAPFYSCPPCHCAEDGVFVEEPGDCSHCGMPMSAYPRAYEYTQEVAHTVASRDDGPRSVGILIFPGVQIIDFAAPYEVFGQAGFRVATVSKSKESFDTAMGLSVTPRYDFSDAPEFDLIVVPGGSVHSVEEDEESLAWLRAREAKVDAMLSVCNGAFILARSGLLDGKRATTFYNLIDGLRRIAPETEVVNDKRYVDNGRIVTTAGLSSGIDGSLHVVEKLLGRAAAQRVALNLEYNWKDDVNYARASFADRDFVQNYIVSIGHYPYLQSSDLTWQLLDTGGDERSWEYRWAVQGAASARALLESFDRKFATDADAANAPLDGDRASWRLDLDGSAWDATVVVARDGDAHLVSLRVDRVGRGR